MATKSILKNINIKDKRMGRSVVSSLEKAKDKETTAVVMSKKVKEIRGDEIGALFGGK
ncbi:hypothetical protein [Anoxynatronum buryatiense]|uniref:Uncharacterized protein n=1 Tax=Anoxynatronum buryatiense TaxID=489973 RepID=A0AA45WSL7_9CLOT|nr:hypothetical protein [Anoxynatronum buryatiense]SMP38232.1 hypothetical protein SAMN06296020_10168 [Anoxynatronum buryatiense]